MEYITENVRVLSKSFDYANLEYPRSTRFLIVLVVNIGTLWLMRRPGNERWDRLDWTVELIGLVFSCCFGFLLMSTTSWILSNVPLGWSWFWWICYVYLSFYAVIGHIKRGLVLALNRLLDL